MRFLFIAPRFHTNQYGVVKGLLDRGHEVRFLARRTGRNECHDQVTPILGEDTFPARMRQLHHILKTYRPDVTIIRGVTLENAVSSCIIRLHGKKIILYTQDPLYIRREVRFRAAARKLLLNTISRVRITPVPGDAHGSFSLAHEYFVPFVVEPQTSPDHRTYFRDGRINILSIGKLTLERKDHILMLRAFKDLRAAYPLRLSLVGSLGDEASPYFARIRDYIRENNLEDGVTIKANLPYDQCRQEYLHHDLFVLPSRSEPAAVSPLEAMSSGMPVICSDTNGTRSYLEEKRNGYIFRSHDLEDLKDKITQVISSRDTLTAMGRESYSIVQEQYLPQRWHNDILRIIERELN